MPQDEFDYDQVVVGSGFGGSCSALRLSEKGYRVLVLEQGKRWRDEDFPRSNWNLRKYLWLPRLGLRGTWRFTFTRRMLVLHGVGVGGGSLIYANTHLIPPDEVFESAAWTRVRGDWKARLAPYYGLAQRMLGVARNEYQNIADHTLHAVAARMGREDTFRTVNSGILFPGDGESGETVSDPYFAGDGPARATCRYCGACMVGCRHNAKNTLVKNYLYFAQRNGVEIRPESRVTRIEPLPDGRGIRDGSAGFELTVERSTAFVFKRRHRIRTRAVVISGGVIGTVPLLLKAKLIDNTLPNVSDALGRRVRTNSETLLSVDFDAARAGDVSRGTTITSVFSPDDETHVEVTRLPKGSDASFAIAPTVPLTDGGGRVPRPLRMLVNMASNPMRALRLLNPVGRAKKTIILLVMQSKESFVHVELRRKWYALFKRGWSVVQHRGDAPLSPYFPIAHETARRFIEESGGDAANSIYEVAADMPATAHIMGGVAMGHDASDGVVDEYGAVFGYENLRVLDGSVIPGNLGVNPSLTILALTEYAMSAVPVLDADRAAEVKSIRFSKPRSGQVSTLDGEGDLLQQIGSPR